MSYSILFRDGKVVREPGDSFDGYVYMNKGRIIKVDKGEVPQEFSFATYLIDGKGRILTPGLICTLTQLSKYPSRYGGREASTSNEIYRATQMALQDLLLSGFTAVGTIESKVEPVARAIANSGIRAVIFVDASSENWKEELQILLNKWHGFEDRIFAGIAALEPNEEAEEIAKRFNLPIITSEDIKEVKGISKERGIVAIEKGGKRSYGFINSKTTSPLNVVKSLYYMGMNPVEALKALTVDAAEILGLSKVGRVKEGYSADVVVWDVSEPPGWTAGHGEPEEIILASNPKVESVIVAGEVIVDISEMLTIGRKDVKEAKRLFGG